MYYQLLGEPIEHNKTYRGTYRYGPTYVDALPSTDPINQLFLKYADNEDRFRDVEDALKLAALYEHVGKEFNVVGVTEINTPSEDTSSNLLGFDVSLGGWWSTLSWGLIWEQVDLPTKPILDLIGLFFRPILNGAGLFSLWEDARFFLDVIRSVSSLAPGTFESEENIVALQITQLVLIRGTPEAEE